MNHIKKKYQRLALSRIPPKQYYMKRIKLNKNTL